MTLRRSQVQVVMSWNGTVVLDAERTRLALNSVLNQRGLEPVSQQQLPQLFRPPLTSILRRLGVRDLGVAAAQWNAEVAKHPAPPRPGVDRLRELREDGVPLSVVTAVSAVSVGADLRRLGLTGLFDSIDSSVADKTEALLRRRTCRTRAFYLGHTTPDMRAAQLAGFTPVAFSGAMAPRDALIRAGAVHVVSTFDEVVALVDDAPVSLPV